MSMSATEARQIVREGCDHPYITEDGRRLYLGGWCEACDNEVRATLADDDVVWTEDE